MDTNLDIKCKKVTFDGETAELEKVDIKSLIKNIIEDIGISKFMEYATEEGCGDLSEIVEYIDDQYDMESAFDCLDKERQEEIREYIT